MKRLALLIIIVMSSCNKQYDIEDFPPPKFHMIKTCETLSDSLDLKVDNYNYGHPISKESMVIVIYTSMHQPIQPELPKTIKDAINSKLYEKAESIFLHETISYCHAGLRNGARIYADKILFGRKAGDNLSDKFKLYYYFPEYSNILSYPDWKILYPSDAVDKPKLFSEFAVEGVLLCGFPSPFHRICFNEIPEEDYNEITFYIEIPITAEYLYDYQESDYEEYQIPKPGDRVLMGKVKVRFGATN